MKLNYQELSTVLAALRVFQDLIDDDELENYRRLPHFDDVEPLTSEQIDTLCEEINTLPE